MPVLFDSWKLGGKIVKNHFSTLPMEANDAAPDGKPTERTIKRYQRLAAGGWGIIYVEAIAPDERGRARPTQLILNKENLDSFKLLIDSIRNAAAIQPVIILQINHAGRYGINPLLAYHNDVLDPTWNIPSDMPEATTAELEQAATASAEAVALSAQIGADGVDVKCCHGYLSIDLMRPANTRKDNFGGILKNRMRFYEIMLDAAAQNASPNFFFGSRISLLEGFSGGFGNSADNEMKFNSDELFPLMMMLQSAGASFVCETLGIPYFNPDLVRPWKKQEDKNKVLAMHQQLTGWVKQNFPMLSVIGTGYTLLGNESIVRANDLIEKGEVDALGFGRQSLADPALPAKASAGNFSDINWCKGCKANNCSYLLRNKVPAGCVIFESYYSMNLRKLKKKLKVFKESGE